MTTPPKTPTKPNTPAKKPLPSEVGVYQPHIPHTPDTTADRRRRGRAAQSLGEATEALFKGYIEAHPTRGHAVKVPTPVQVKRAVGHGQVIGELRAPVAPDFMGWWKGEAGLAPLAVEVKHAQDTAEHRHRFALPDKLRADKGGHQAAFLQRLARDGGIAAVFVWQQSTRAEYFVPIHPDLGALPSLDVASWPWDALLAYRVPPMTSLAPALDHWTAYRAGGWAAALRARTLAASKERSAKAQAWGVSEGEQERNYQTNTDDITSGL